MADFELYNAIREAFTAAKIQVEVFRVLAPRSVRRAHLPPSLVSFCLLTITSELMQLRSVNISTGMDDIHGDGAKLRRYI
jgi:hypothetical protein